MKNYFIDSTLIKSVGLDELLHKLPVISPYGRGAKKALSPISAKDYEKLSNTLDDFTFFKEVMDSNKLLLSDLKKNLMQYKDLSGTFVRIQRGEVLDEVELFEIKGQIFDVIQLKAIISKSMLKNLKIINLKTMSRLLTLLDPDDIGMKTFYLYDSYKPQLKEIRLLRKKLEADINFEDKSIKEKISKELGIKLKSNGEISVYKEDNELLQRLTNRQEVYLSNEGINNYSFRIKKTQYIEELIVELEEIKLVEEDLEFQVREELTEEIKKYIKDIIDNTRAIGQLDLLIGKYIFNMKINGVKPRLVKGHFIEIKEGRHVIVEDLLRGKGSEYTPIDIKLSQGVTLITGANMGGKTVTLKLIALIMIMAQMGLYVPAKEAVIGPVDFLHLSIGDHQSIEAGLSSFGAEIRTLNKVLARAGEGGLILMDELARGTNPKEGYGISKGIIEYLKTQNSISVITSHFDGLCEIEGITHLQVMGLKRDEIELNDNMYKEGKYVEGFLEKHMDYRLIAVKGSKEVPKDAIFIAQLMGLREDIIKEAEKAIEGSSKNTNEEELS
ncbi:lysine 5,6-aminomutase reactivase ATPase KamC [Alkaliphilus peptidifermentans]|uniref:MutS domain V n=1 Tax=Alkaliphilus peptidifermentans DSM 18978 TaxID=1120976 RepID=A0A1G5KIM0_9FIRM|nr:hypothetical protein [Alkaliphilus peptidifermentans]SCY99898.1 MutS domain V [Alkaliphilus peptidifermentans DSM 18978]